MLVRKNFNEADQVQSVPHGRLEIVALPGQTLARAVLEPGWRWSEDMKPLAGTASCEVAHTAYVVSGRMHVRMDDGRETDLAAGDAHFVGPGHDAWVVGDEPLIIIDVVGAGDTEHTTGETAAPRVTGSCPCGVEYSAPSEAQEELITAIQQHALHSHQHEASREQILAELTGAVAAAQTV